MTGRRLIVLVALVATFAAGCSPTSPSGPSPAGGPPSSAGASAEATVGTPPETISPSAAYALPRVDGKPLADPAVSAKNVREVVKPGADVLLTPSLLRLYRESVEGTMIVRIESYDGSRKELVARVIRFRVPHQLSANESPAVFTLPKGTLVRIQLPDARQGEKPIPVAGLMPGDTAALRVRMGLVPGGVVLRLLAVQEEGGATQ